MRPLLKKIYKYVLNNHYLLITVEKLYLFKFTVHFIVDKTFSHLLYDAPKNTSNGLLLV